MEKENSSEFDSFSKEMKLLLYLLRLDKHNDTPNKELYSYINWDRFLDLVMHHRVFPIIYQNINTGSRDWIPSFIVKVLAREYKRNTLQMLHLSAEMIHLNNQFIENQIQTIFLKGPVLAVELYDDISLRTSCDLDLLVDRKELNRAEEILIEDGYIKDDYILSVLNDWKWRHHHITFHHPLKGIKVEVHWRLNPGPAKEPSFKELWERRRISTIINIPINILGKEDLFLFLVSHGARHGWSRLRWLLDIDRIIKQNINWNILIQLLQENHYKHIGGQALILSSQLLMTPLDEENKQLTTNNRSKGLALSALFYIKQMVNLHTEPLPESIARYHKRHLFSLMSSHQKILFILSFLFPYYEDVTTLPLPKNLHILYFLLRPFLWAWRKTRKLAFGG